MQSLSTSFRYRVDATVPSSALVCVPNTATFRIVLHRLRVGKARVAHELAKYNPAINPLCGQCGTQEETIEHLLLKCSSYSKERTDFFRTLGTKSNMSDLAISDFLAGRAVETPDLTYRFLDETGLLETL